MVYHRQHTGWEPFFSPQIFSDILLDKKAERFLEKLKGQLRIKELATNPLLLTLLCLVFEGRTDFPANRSELYEEALGVLLKKWDGTRSIEREQVYRELSLKRKEDLLSQLALTTFGEGNYFFKQKNAERLIEDYIQNLPNAQTAPDALRLDSEAVLKSIEAQHGLLVERARGIYSFSHLTFHEYFTARELEKGDKLHVSLMSHLMEKRWREVFLLTVGMLRSADSFLSLMKSQIDKMLTNDVELQQFLNWVQQKSDSVEAPYKSAAIRAFYFDRALDLDRALDCSFDRALESIFELTHVHSLDLDYTRSLDLDLDCTFSLDLDRALDITLDRILACVLNRVRILNFDLKLDPNLNYALSRARTLNRGHTPNLARARERACAQNAVHDYASVIEHAHACALSLGRTFACALTLALVHDRVLDLSQDPGFDIDSVLGFDIDHVSSSYLSRALKDLIAQLPDPDEDIEHFINFWNASGIDWVNRLRVVMIEHRSIGHDWKFSEAQRDLLWKYYDANKLLVDCLNSDCYVSRAIRQEIENSLLLPIAEIKKRFPLQQQLYAESSVSE